MTIINIVGFILIFGILVFVHELGHFLAARRNGIVTEEFGFGYPPRVVTLRKGDGKLVVDDKALVVPGGYELPEDLVAGSLVTIQTTPDKKGRPVLTNVEVISPDDPLRSNAGVVSMIDPGTIYSINAIPFGGFVRMRGEDGPAGPGSFANASAGARAVTLLAGPGMNLLLAVIIFSISFMLGRPDAVPGGRIDEVAPGSPAELAGLAVGDRIFLIGDKEVRTASDVGDYVQAHPGEPVAMTIDRNGERMVVTLTPRVSPPEGQGPVGVTVYPVTEITRYGVGESLIRGAEDTARFTYFTLSVPSMLMKGVITPSEARPVGPKAIFDLTSGAITATQDSGLWFPVLQLMGILSAALAITNLLPIPALDGGRLLFIIIEKVRGRRVDPNWEGAIHLAGMLVLLGLMVIITYQDFASPVPLPDWLAPLGR
ncbi:MAG: site-2 protease family protein [Anaerolineae bacterium]|nr:site-2 protease family protein [Anaerolineae bacterium]MCB9132654.1 site-2 protease family protein [Anaerolineales bacterium]MCB0230102.1 site-2 protease family protein [Anaerolineae bacterium]MCB0233883.1 site-2 protease family protein [Anaerolineae bacterium]MCB0239088.1 site-2 protease family protein [Anaerolineae bacterium]